MASSSENKRDKISRMEKEIEYHLYSLARISKSDPTIYGRPVPSDANTVHYNLPKNITDDMLEQLQEAANRMAILKKQLESIGTICDSIRGSIKHWMRAIDEAIIEEDDAATESVPS